MYKLIGFSHICFCGGRWSADTFFLLILQRTADDGQRTPFSFDFAADCGLVPSEVVGRCSADVFLIGFAAVGGLWTVDGFLSVIRHCFLSFHTTSLQRVTHAIKIAYHVNHIANIDCTISIAITSRKRIRRWSPPV